MRRFALLFAAAAAALAGCGSSSGVPGKPAAATLPSAEVTRSPAGHVTVTTHDSQYGRILGDGRGRALYVFTRETNTSSRCYGACARAWPPFIAAGVVRAKGAARQRLVSTTRRRDGSRQVTYAGRPVYFYVGDRKPGQVLCQGVVEFGGTWLVADAAGRPVR